MDSGDSVKACTKCGEVKPATAEFFQRRKAAPDGLNTQCKVCLGKYYSKWRRDNPGKSQEYTSRWREKHPDRYREIVLANREAMRENGARWYRENKDRKAEQGRRWRRENPERAREIGRRNYQARRDEILARHSEWARENRDKTREYRARRRAKMADATVDGVTIDASAIEARFEVFGWRCYICGADSDQLEADHVIPLSGGGLHVPANIRPACISCNRSKHAGDWREYVGAACGA